MPDALIDPESHVALGESPMTLEDVAALANRRKTMRLAPSDTVRERLVRSRAVVTRRLESGPAIYGVTTGFGAACENSVPVGLASELPRNLFRYHGAGVGAPLAEVESFAVLAVRAASLARGHSGIRPEVIEHLCALLDAGIAPVIPSLGSVGASGDLTPLSYVAAVLSGEREAFVSGRRTSAREALAEASIEPLELAPKESLALMNGTSVMTALTALGALRSQRLAHFACVLTAMGIETMQGQRAHFDERIFAAKPHLGTIDAAERIRAALACEARPAPHDGRIQDRYSLRCAPHVIGTLVDALRAFRPLIEIEINGAGDNPLIDADTGDVLHGGNFYGGHMAFVADSLKSQVASIAELLERQLVLLLRKETNGGMPDNLVGLSGPERVAHHGFKAMEITASALTAEALKQSMPAGAFSRSTEGHNQDKVSMGTIAARDLGRTLDLAELVAIIHALALCQAYDLRKILPAAPSTRALYSRIRESIPMVREDRAMDSDISQLLAAFQSDALSYEHGP